MIKVYYSKMNVTPNANILWELQIIKDHFGPQAIQFHNSGKYDETKLTNSDVVIVTGYGKGLVGKGVYSEISNAIENNIPVFQFADEKVTKMFFHIEEINLHNRSDVYREYGHAEVEEDEDGDSVGFSLKEISEFAAKLNLGSKKVHTENDDTDTEETNMMY